jgi:hypothetical protein
MPERGPKELVISSAVRTATGILFASIAAPIFTILPALLASVVAGPPDPHPVLTVIGALGMALIIGVPIALGSAFTFATPLVLIGRRLGFHGRVFYAAVGASVGIAFGATLNFLKPNWLGIFLPPVVFGGALSGLVYWWFAERLIPPEMKS